MELRANGAISASTRTIIDISDSLESAACRSKSCPRRCADPMGGNRFPDPKQGTNHRKLSTDLKDFVGFFR